MSRKRLLGHCDNEMEFELALSSAFAFSTVCNIDMGNLCSCIRKNKEEEEHPNIQNGTCVGSTQSNGSTESISDDAPEEASFDYISKSNVAENNKGKHAPTHVDAHNQENNTEPKRNESTVCNIDMGNWCSCIRKNKEEEEHPNIQNGTCVGSFSKSNVAENNKGKHAPTHVDAHNQETNTEPKRNESERPHTSTLKGDRENDKLQDDGQDANDQLKTQTSGSYYSDEIDNRIQTSSNKFYPVQTQKQDQLARQKEASKELLYRVYENVIGTLEEFERRCNKRHTKQMLVVSEIDFPDQSDKSDRDVKANMDVQLLLFEEHRKSCPPKFTKKVNGELRMKTIYWAAARGETDLDETDKYTTNLYEILVKDKTHHAVLDRPRQPVEHKTMRETLQFIMKGNAKAMEIEGEYQTDPDKMAKDPKTRKTEIRPYVGAKRIYMCNTDLQPYLDQDVPGFLESDIK